MKNKTGLASLSFFWKFSGQYSVLFYFFPQYGFEKPDIQFDEKLKKGSLTIAK